MAILLIPIEVEFADGKIMTVVSDQRDLAQAEAHGATSVGRHTATRCTAWAALTRTGQYKGTWERFNEVDALEVRDNPAEEPDGDEDGLDPGRTTPNAAGE